MAKAVAKDVTAAVQVPIGDEKKERAEFLERQRLEQIEQDKQNAAGLATNAAANSEEEARNRAELAANGAAVLMRPLSAREKLELERLEEQTQGIHRDGKGRPIQGAAGRMPISSMKRLADLRRRAGLK